MPCFNGCTSLEEIPAELFYNNIQATSFAATFGDCTALKEIPTKTFNTTGENVSMYGTFGNCNALTTIKNEAFNIPNIGNLNQCFKFCYALKQIEGGFVIPETVTDIQYMFSGCDEVETNVTLRSNQAKYNKTTFNKVGANFRLNWAGNCTEEIVNEILKTCGREDIKGSLAE